MFSRIVVPLDGSDVAEYALVPAMELARRLEVELHLIRITDMTHVDVTSMYGYMLDSRLMAEQVRTEMDLAREYLEENARALTLQGFDVTIQTAAGSAPAELVGAMKAGDLFVIASHGRSGIARWYLGSVAEQIMRQATVPVMVVRGHQPVRHEHHLAEATVSP